MILALVGWELPLVPDATNILESIGYEDEKLTNYINYVKKCNYRISNKRYIQINSKICK